MRKQIRSISRQAMEMLTNYPWNGNVRELANFIERAVIFTRGQELEVPISERFAPLPRRLLLLARPLRSDKRNRV